MAELGPCSHQGRGHGTGRGVSATSSSTGLGRLMPALGKPQDMATLHPSPLQPPSHKGGTEQCHHRHGVLSLLCAASANRREMGFPAASERGLNNKWQQRELSSHA